MQPEGDALTAYTVKLMQVLYNIVFHTKNACDACFQVHCLKAIMFFTFVKLCSLVVSRSLGMFFSFVIYYRVPVLLAQNLLDLVDRHQLPLDYRQSVGGE